MDPLLLLATVAQQIEKSNTSKLTVGRKYQNRRKTNDRICSKASRKKDIIFICCHDECRYSTVDDNQYHRHLLNHINIDRFIYQALRKSTN